MVAKKTAKTAKLSYPERVLGAFTQVQKEHRKHAIHTLTLRAQVIKTAQARKDKLGPHWPRFVTKAIHRLEDEGVLAASDPAGTFTLTPAGKKAINAARQSLSLSTNATPLEEELIWKQVALQASNGGLKRGRQSSVRASLASDEETPSSFKAKSKRPRISTSVSPVKKPVAKMTKAELRKELRNAQEDNNFLRDSSPLTDIDDSEGEEEESNPLREELRRRIEDVEQMRLELVVAKGQAPPGGTHSGTSHRLLTPETIIDSTPSSPQRPPYIVRSRPLLGVIRTQSGSLVSQLSKRPTPAPSTPGASPEDHSLNNGAAHDEDENDSGGFNVSVMHEITEGGHPRRILNGPATLAPGDTGVENLNKILELERSLDARTLEMQKLEAELSRLQEKYSASEKILSERDSRILVLLADTAKLEKDASDKAAACFRKDSENALLRATKADLEATYKSHLDQLGQSLRERDASMAALESDRERYLSEMSNLQQALSHAESTISAHADQDADAAALRSEMLERHKSTENELEIQKALTLELEEKMQLFRTQTEELNQVVDQLRDSKDKMAEYADSLSQAVSQLSVLSEKLEETETSNESLLSQLSVAMDEKSAVQVALDAAEASVTALTSQVVGLEESISQSKTNTDELSQSLAMAHDDAATLRQKITMTELLVSTLQSDLKISKETAAGLTAELAAVTSEHADLLMRIENEQKAASASAQSLDELKAILTTTTDDLRAAERVAAESQLNLDTTVANLRAAEDRNRGLVENLTKKEAESGQLAEHMLMAESMAEKFRDEAKANETKARDLLLQFTELQGIASAAQELLSTTETSHALESSQQRSVISEIENHLKCARTEAEGLKTDLHSAWTVNAELQAQLDAQVGELADVGAKLEEERKRAAKLETDLLSAVDKVQVLEEEISDLNASKKADETTIEELKGMFANLRETQTRSFAEMTSKVVSTHSSPMPARRSNRKVSKAPPPFKLT